MHMTAAVFDLLLWLCVRTLADMATGVTGQSTVFIAERSLTLPFLPSAPSPGLLEALQQQLEAERRQAEEQRRTLSAAREAVSAELKAVQAAASAEARANRSKTAMFNGACFAGVCCCVCPLRATLHAWECIASWD